MPKLFIGPITKNVVDSIIEYCNKYDVNIGFILSRRQIDYNGGYVGWNTIEFVNYVRNKTDKIIIERDHSGIGQGKNYDSGKLSQYYDARRDLDIIHVDPWKKYKNYRDGLLETIDNIKLINSINNKCLFEVGTEESIRKFEIDEFDIFLKDLEKNLGNLFSKLKYAVIQSGSKLIETKNIGVFDLNKLNKMIEICNKYGILSKEHNGDYLSDKEIKQKFDNGLSAINIAPEYGVFETNIILDYIKNDEILIDKIFNICYNSKTWVKWVNDDFIPNDNKIKLIQICGHYVNKKIKKLSKIDDNIIKKEIILKLEKLTYIT